MMQNFDVQDPITFLASFLQHAEKAQRRIWLQTMNFDPGTRVNTVVDRLITAAQNNIDVRINADWMSEMFYEGEFDFSPLQRLVSPTKIRQQHRAHEVRNAMYDSLRTAGAELTITNLPNILTYVLPVIGRNHIKMYLVDDVAWVGGINLMESSFDTIDFMVKLDDPCLVDALVEQFPRINLALPPADYAVECGESTLLIDSGRFAKSLIHDSAVNEIKSAQKDILYVSQMVPDFEVLDEMISAAKLRHVNVEIVSSFLDDVLFQKHPYKWMHRRYLSKTKNIQNMSLTHMNKKLHSKLLIVDGERAIFGSHNFSQLGGLFGTQEIALSTRDASLVAQLQEHMRAVRAAFNSP